VIGFLLCLSMVTHWEVARPLDRSFAVCQALAVEAELAGLDQAHVLALAYTETRLNPEAVSTAGARGPIQVLPRYHCPRRRARGCDFMRVGVAHLARLVDKYGTWDLVLCHWNGGLHCGRKARRFARIVIERARKLAAIPL